MGSTSTVGTQREPTDWGVVRENFLEEEMGKLDLKAGKKGAKNK